MKKTNICLALLLGYLGVLLFSGCAATGNLSVVKPLGERTKVASIDCIEVGTNVSVSPQIKAYFESRLREQLYQPGNFQKGPDIKIEYSFMEVKPGSRFMRWLTGRWGTGSLRVEAKFVNPAGDVLSVVRTEGKVAGGGFALLGGSFNLAINKAIDGIVKYSKQNFGP